MRKNTLFFLVALALLALTASADISVRIMDAPDNVLLYSPVYVLAVVQNNGNKTELVPVNEWDRSNGWLVEISDANGHLLYTPDFYGDSSGDYVVPLKPREKYYFFHDAGEKITEPGVYEVRVALQSDGDCEVTEEETFPVQIIPGTENRRFPHFGCWAGKVTSEVVKVLISNPSSAEDLKVLDYVKSTESYKQMHSGFPDTNPSRYDFSRAYREMQTLFPENYYTYVAGLYAANGSTGALEQLVKLHPNHPLDRFSRTLWGQSLIFDTAKDLSSKLPNLDLSDALRAYLAQYQEIVERQQVLKKAQKQQK